MEIIRARKSKLSLDMAPLIDVVFQLLIFFMLTSSFSHATMNVALPKAKTVDQPQQEKIVISISETGDIFLNEQKTSMEFLRKDLSVYLQDQSSVHIKGDKNMPYKFFVEVMDTARQAGAKQINIIHQKDIK